MNRDYRDIYNQILKNKKSCASGLFRERGVDVCGSDQYIESELALIVHLLDRVIDLEKKTNE